MINGFISCDKLMFFELAVSIAKVTVPMIIQFRYE